MDAIDIRWDIVITSNGQPMGQPVKATGWDCHSKLAAIKARVPAGWHVEAYAMIHAMRGPMGEAIGHRSIV